MKVGIVGPGAIGLLFTYYLQKESNAVTIYTRTEEQAQNIRKKGITCIINHAKYTVFPHALPLDGASLQDDYILVAVKQYQLPSVLSHLHRASGKLIFLQNGMAHLSMLQDFDQATAVGIVEHGAKKENDTTVVHTGAGITRLGIISGHEDMFQSLFSLFTEVFPLVIEKNWKEIVVNKLVINACVNPLTALYRVKNGEMLKNEHFNQVMKSVCKEVLCILGESNLEEHWIRVCHVCEKTADNQSSMLTDVIHHRQTEVDAILGYILAKADEKGQTVPILSFLYHSMKGLEHKR